MKFCKVTSTHLSAPPSSIHTVHHRTPDCYWSLRHCDCIPARRKGEGQRRTCPLSLRTFYIHSIYIWHFHLPSMGKKLATMPHLAPKESGKCDLYYRYPGLQLNQQYCYKGRSQEYIFGGSLEPLQRRYGFLLYPLFMDLKLVYGRGTDHWISCATHTNVWHDHL